MSRRKRMMQDLDQDIRDHIARETQDNIDRGMSPQDARYAAMRKFGNVLRVKEETREVWTLVWVEQLVQDFRFAFRTLRKNPGFALTAVLILALGIAANVIVFGVLQGLVLRQLDVPHAEQVMTLQPKTGGGPFLSYPEMRDVRDTNNVFSAVAAVQIQAFGLEANGFTRPVWGDEVTGQYFEVVGIKPFLGRLLERSDDDHPGASFSALLSWPAWKNDFAADPNIVGKTIRLDKQPYTIVGVTPEGFYGTEKIADPDIFVPMANLATVNGVSWLDSRTYKNIFSVVRLKDGVTKPQVQAELNTIATRISQQFPKEEEGLALKLAPPGLVGDFIGGPTRGFLAAVMALAGIVLLAACANLGSLFAARTADRTREIAIRMAVGSSRWRILRQLLVEALVISVFGGACASFLGWMALSGLANWHPPGRFPLKFHVMPEPSLILMAFFISVVAGIVFGLMPLRQIFKTDPNAAIKSGGNQSSAGRRWALRDVLLAAQIALCCVTVTAAFVSLRGLGKALTMDLGFNPKNAILTRFDLSQANYASEADADHFQRQLLEKIQQIPGIEAAGYANTTPLDFDANVADVFPEDSTDLRHSKSVFGSYTHHVSPGYLAAAGTPLLAGRDVSFSDTPKTPAVAIVNQEFARRLFHTQQAVGRYFKNRSGVSIQVIGIMGDSKYFTLSEDPQAAAFFPVSQKTDTRTTLIVRSQRDTADIVSAIRETIRALDVAVPISESGPWASQLGLSLFPSQVATVALGIFGAFGLLLSIAGTFGLASYTVSKRLRELSIRVALGAGTKQILQSALGRMLILLASGSAIGIALGLGASHLLSAIVYQASAQDPVVLTAVVLTTVLTATLSVAGPVRRVLHADPATLLREQ
jgi:predicted permease